MGEMMMNYQIVSGAPIMFSESHVVETYVGDMYDFGVEGRTVLGSPSAPNLINCSKLSAGTPRPKKRPVRSRGDPLLLDVALAC